MNAEGPDPGWEQLVILALGKVLGWVLSTW